MQIYHNPRCSKSRETLALLQEKGAKPEIIEYLKTPPSARELDQICQKLGIEPQALIRSKEALFKELGLSLKDTRSRNEWLKILAEHPSLIERPIVVAGSKAALGRPPENVLDLI
ncbi:arsenate reductase (glutaredoxin) [bacterium (Candidatus Blackallbacteria) CG17_big_fil_post_rev_8_21_14_2_50_48_46]|uniref:Arsenate reductase (Glutaredoxin) n=1 Tax=bacterium (Candidatus Blackallbacteria) CG17_big_fil_post_rev_8_21_14_2_50_48_46 TaxID=2014261 RepID=A0A2M7FZS8_9BACT|nr:MAG: arsenate reductase (glutaredoxin) [bacterium (Candidatus Blackallbacteria) CG18_big_fil_WC_8_21_14_2_50_49_26]PIW14788.1 MAG: arsenate reductase (glutaredoxin) [bacterium (Candidatus Blackallbacteria) CG17_big_fil_post_rev_8_21_14_2_50_48_46]PIW50890.1 MAG: arsenate reductase (glutaredoxin) [bacterium (Candidatus Blackallbacteria) CG13_big_fil_rev_8_21_14_2_50_49_14]